MDFYTTDTLNRVVANILGSPQFLIDRYFPNVQTEASEEIHFDVIDGKRRIAPFVSPLVEGQIVAPLGYKTFTFKPAYIKDKRVFDMNKPLKRSPGEPIGGDLSPAARQRALIAREMQDQLPMLTRRCEVMAGDILANGKTTVTGDKYPTVIVDFGRAAGNSVTAGTLWSAAGSNPIADMGTWSTAALQSQGIMLNDVIMTPPVWKVFRANQAVNDYLGRIRIVTEPPTLAGTQTIGEGGFFMGTIDIYNIWVYQGWYVDPLDGVEKTILPQDSIIMTSPQLEGVRAYGAIRDEEAGLQPLPYFVKSWTEPDPSVRFIMLQSAPLLVPYRVNASLKGKVI